MCLPSQLLESLGLFLLSSSSSVFLDFDLDRLLAFGVAAGFCAGLGIVPLLGVPRGFGVDPLLGVDEVFGASGGLEASA
jgi:hypothetical protein